MCEKNSKPVELTNNQMEQVSGGASVFLHETAASSQSSDIARIRNLANPNIQDRDDTENDRNRGFGSTSVNRPRPRE